MEIKSEQLSQYITAVIQSVKSGVSSEAYMLEGSIEFDLALSISTENGGGLKIYVAKAEGKHKAEEINRIKFKVRGF